ncbi:MAG TPA: PAS domain-containing protein [Verrucomicrobiae bacterium]|nr:PAS domain-containing protein [Verrucomicrobiae bacterium]
MAFNLKKFLARGPELIQAETVFVREIPLSELGLTAIYVVIAGLWCVFSDELLDRLLDSPQPTPALETLKGFNFVFTTSLVLYLVLRRAFRTRRLAEEASRLNQQRFELVAHATTDTIWDLNLQTKIVWWSSGIEQLFGYRAEDVSPRLDWWLERLHPDDRERVTRELERVAESSDHNWAGHYRFRRQDGTYASVQDRGYIIHDATGKPARVVGGISDITERRRAEEALESSRRQLRALTARLQSGREEERANVAREIHDELGQVLTAIKMNLDWLERKLGEREDGLAMNPFLERVVESAEMTDSAIKNVQRIATQLRPEALDNLGLAEALLQEANRFEQRGGAACELQLTGERLNLPGPVVTTVFRVFQEALTNVARHANATLVRISLEATTEQVLLHVEDNGQGILPESTADSRSLGLLGMQERAWALGGEVTISPVLPRGTRVTLRLPRTANDTRFWADL